MTVKELNIGDVFRVGGEAQLWRKTSPRVARRVGPTFEIEWQYRDIQLKTIRDARIEVVDRAGEICRAEHLLILRGGEVVLEHHGALRVHRCTPGDPLTEFVLAGSAFFSSHADAPTAETALLFGITVGSRHLGRPSGSDVIAYNGRVYGRATKKDVLGKSAMGGYKVVRTIDGAKRMIIAGLLGLPSEFALYDIIMEHFGPDTVPR